MEEKLICPICGEPTNKYYGNYRKDRLCFEHGRQANAGAIEQCPECGEWHKSDEECSCKKNEVSQQELQYTELPYNGFDKCIKCGKDTYGYAFCSECYYKQPKEELLQELNNFIKERPEVTTQKAETNENNTEEVTIQVINKKCLLCENDSGEYMFCKSCFSQYRNKTLLLKVTVDSNQKIELLNESYEGIYVCKDGHVVKSKSERDIDNYLFEHKIAHAYEKALPIKGEIFKPDFYLPDLDVYIEHWGYDETNIDYTRRKD